jgi:3-hydroxyisobutyrate dehydrogenase-like beta-hydroxyacid dehydrogenase
MKEIGFIGLGVMGSAMAGNLLSAGYSLRVWNRTASKAKPLVERGASTAASPAEAAAGADAVITMVGDDDALRQVCYGERGLLEALPAGSLHLSMSTVSAALIAELARAHRQRGSWLLAVPVFGSKEAALSKKLWAVAAGDRAAFERARPLIEAMAHGVAWLGPDPNAAASLKLIGNLLISAAVAGIVQAFTLARQAGLTAEQVMDMIHHVFDSIVYERYGRRLVARDFSLHFPLKLMLKDVSLGLELGASLGVPMPLAAAVREMVVAATGQGYADKDAAASLLETWESIARP